MNIGRMDRNIVLQQPTYAVSSDTNDRPITGWTTYKTLWASWVNRQSQEVFESGQMVTKETFEWKIRYFDAPAVKMDMRILYDSKYYYLVGTKELGRKEAWMLTSINRDN